jgi:hypothetical protein
LLKRTERKIVGGGEGHNILRREGTDGERRRGYLRGGEGNTRG